ncbi:hypothetical protein [Alteribacter aurantiacus]|uniref:hypothetical protein n=1 Tax=Alteribacter aurantiacus TaxID=254410 RepID=UPI00040ECAC1|nr:hypothetical protein [Alteribacter aurantiacus]
MKMFLISLLSGMVIGLIIAFFVYTGEPLFFQIEHRYANETVFIRDHNVEMVIGTLRIMFFSFITIFLAWLLIGKIVEKGRPQEG